MRNSSRPASVPGASGVLIASLAIGFVIASAVCAYLLVAVGGYAGTAAAFAVNSLVCFALPGFVSRVAAVGTGMWSGVGRDPFSVIGIVILLTMACQPFLEFTSSMDAFCASALGVPDDLARANKEMLGGVCLFDSVGHWAVAILVLAILPAVSEELFFRGAFLPLLRRATGSWHVAVFVSAVVFSAVHMDPSGFITRTVLGLLLGAVFAITRSLWAPMLLHFTNNAMAVFCLSLTADPVEALSAERSGQSIILSVASLVGTMALIYLLQQNERKNWTLTSIFKKINPDR